MVSRIVSISRTLIGSKLLKQLHGRVEQILISGQEKTVSPLRQSESAWVADGESKLVDRLNHRMNWITGLQTSSLLDPEVSGSEVAVSVEMPSSCAGHGGV